MGRKSFATALPVCFVVWAVCSSWALSSTESCPKRECVTPSFHSCMTCNNEPKNVTLNVVNVLKEPRLNMSLTVNNTYQRYLLGIMEEAASYNTSYRFSAIYYGTELGYYIDAFDFVYANYSLDNSYWRILDGDGLSTPVGASNYVPKNGETVTFNLTIYA